MSARPYYEVDPSAALAPFLAKPYERGGVRMTVQAVGAAGLSAEDRRWVWALLEGNMRPVYGDKAWGKGGEGKDKAKEMVEEETRYLIAREAPAGAATGTSGDENADPVQTGAPLGFVHYRCACVTSGSRRHGLTSCISGEISPKDTLPSLHRTVPSMRLGVR